MEEDHSWKKPVFNVPREVFLPHHVAGNGRVPGRGDLGWRVHWLGFHSPHVAVADVVVHHGGEGWREGQASRGKERMITTPVQQENCTKHNCIKLVNQILPAPKRQLHYHTKTLLYNDNIHPNINMIFVSLCEPKWEHNEINWGKKNPWAD